MIRKRRSSSRVHPFSSFLATIGVALLGLVVFSLTQSYEPETPPPVEAPAPTKANWGSTFSERVAGVTARLEKSPLSLPPPSLQPQANPIPYTLRQYEVTLPRDSMDRLRAALALARGDDPTVAYSLDPRPGELFAEIGVDGLRTHTILVHWANAAAADQHPRMAVVIDDLGNNLLTARMLVSIDAPLTFAVMPFRPFSRQVAEVGHMSGRDILLHLPMEADDEEEHGEVGILRVSERRDELLQQLDRGLADVPYVIGVNNHMGSRFTQDREKMTWVLQALKQRQLFFLDSKTSPQSAGREVAEKVGIPFLSRDVFLDDGAGNTSVAQQLVLLLETAKKRGVAIGIGHPHPATIAALQSLPELAKAQGVTIVSLSKLLPQ